MKVPVMQKPEKVKQFDGLLKLRHLINWLPLHQPSLFW